MRQLLPRASISGQYAIRPSLGDVTTAQAVSRVGGTSAGAVTAAAAPSVAAALGISTSLAVPIVGAAFAGILLGVELILNSGCGQTCIVTSEWADQGERLIQDAVKKYFALPTRTTEDQRSALNVFDAVWAGLVQRCSQSGLGTAGVNCINDRTAGACKWKQTADSWLLQYPGEPRPGECWNWFNGYRDIIANDTGVVAPSAVEQLTATGQSLQTTVGSAAQSIVKTVESSPLLALGVIGLLAYALMGDQN